MVSERSGILGGPCRVRFLALDEIRLSLVECFRKRDVRDVLPLERSHNKQRLFAEGPGPTGPGVVKEDSELVLVVCPAIGSKRVDELVAGIGVGHSVLPDYHIYLL